MTTATYYQHGDHHHSSAGELLFCNAWQAMYSPQPEREYRFLASRRWRFDFAWPAQRVAVEIDGGAWLPRGGRHNTDADREKLNYAAAQGWRVLRFSTQQLTDDLAACLDLVHAALTYTEEQK